MSNKQGLSAQRLRELSDLFIVVLVVFVAGVFHQELNPWFSWDRQAIDAGQWWRLLSANLMHLNVNHMLMNLSVYVLAAILFQASAGWKQWYASIVLIGLGVGLGLYWFDPNLVNYVGLSGLLYGLIAQQLLLQCRQQPLIYLLIYAVLVYKVVSQQGDDFEPSEMKEFIGGNVVASSHLIGLICGNFIAASIYLYRALFTMSKINKEEENKE
ncbi:rhombosortase [Agaribacterium sp. ZY112]|uniref:rhombosortase n=1 Tax=Agaribacterium sp. ZY112 TaxID=3233574 RepID=UPI003523D842